MLLFLHGFYFFFLSLFLDQDEIMENDDDSTLNLSVAENSP